MTIRNKAVAWAVALAIGVGGYLGMIKINYDLAEEFQKSNQPIVGTVLSERYSTILTSNPEFRGLVSYSNETVRLGSIYTLKIRTDDGKILGVSIIDGGTVKKESLDAIIDEGTRISFPAGNWKSPSWSKYERIVEGETYFTPDTRAGTKRADRIKVF
jgi:hypothetical protein